MRKDKIIGIKNQTDTGTRRRARMNKADQEGSYFKGKRGATMRIRQLSTQVIVMLVLHIMIGMKFYL